MRHLVERLLMSNQSWFSRQRCTQSSIRAVLLVSYALVGLGCGSETLSESDAATLDAGVLSADAAVGMDGSLADGGTHRMDAGSDRADAGPSDSGLRDTGTVAVDEAGTVMADAGTMAADGGIDAGSVMVDAGTMVGDAGVDAGTIATDAGGDAGMIVGDAGPATGFPVSVGYYVEDPVDNPEDPTVGTLLVVIPTADGPFSGQIPFSYFGCSDGADIALLVGTRSGSTLSGTWSGSVDGTDVSGGFDVAYSAANDRWDGTFTTLGGKVRIDLPPCQYHLAGHGTIRVFGSPSNEPPSFVATETGGTQPMLSWPSRGGGYIVRLFDIECVAATPGDPTCFMGEALQYATSVSYPSGFSGSRGDLVAGRTYVATITALSLSGEFMGFSTVVLNP